MTYLYKEFGLICLFNGIATFVAILVEESYPCRSMGTQLTILS